ncbi:MAG: HAD family hydrolase, partial [Chloroflexota bacterium]|nr:HAD family hydrolase [Chloroflexota bacterium]
MPAPRGPAEFAIALSQWVGERVHAEIPGAADAVRSLAGRGLRLHMASGGQSWELDPYLRALDIRRHFDRLYGPDLVDRYKNGAHYYGRSSPTRTPIPPGRLSWATGRSNVSGRHHWASA